MLLGEIKWDAWDSSKPTIWQISYVKQLMQQCEVDHMDIVFTRNDYSLAIIALLIERNKRSKT